MSVEGRRLSADHAHHSVIVQQRRRAVLSKKQSGKSLGAVKLKDATQHEELASSEGLEQENVDPQPSASSDIQKQEREGAGGGPRAQTSVTARFQDELARTCTADKWFDEQLTECQTEGRRRSTGGAVVSRSNSTHNRLAHQLRSFQEALKQHLYEAFTDDSTSESRGSTGSISRDTDSPLAFREADYSSGGTSILDLGMNAISKVGQTLNNFADRVDTTIEQWLESFQSLEDLQKYLDAGPEHQSATSSSLGSHKVIPTSEMSHEGCNAVAEELQAPSKLQHMQRSTVTTNTRNVQRGSRRQPQESRSSVEEASLRDAMARKEEEHRRMQQECRRLHAELTYAANKCSALSEENSLLRRHLESGSPESASPQMDHSATDGLPLSPKSDGMGEPDPMTDLMAKQLEALLTEKSKLAQENARLERENNNLHDILSYSFAAHNEDEDGEESDSITEGDPSESWVPVQGKKSGGNPGGAALTVW